MHKLLDTLRRINDNYGRGRVVGIKLLANSSGQAKVEYGWVAAGQPKMVEMVKFTVSENKVSFRGQTRTIGFQPRY